MAALDAAERDDPDLAVLLIVAAMAVHVGGALRAALDRHRPRRGRGDVRSGDLHRVRRSGGAQEAQDPFVIAHRFPGRGRLG